MAALSWLLNLGFGASEGEAQPVRNTLTAAASAALTASAHPSLEVAGKPALIAAARTS